MYYICTFQINRNASITQTDQLLSNNQMKNPYNPESSRKVAIPEGRMRAQEASRYSNSLEANISNRAGPAFPVASSYRRSDAALSDKRMGTVARNTEPAHKAAAATNPFDEEDDATNDYDDAKNPFADGVDAKAQRKDDKVNLNPFDDVDDNSNPFA